MLDVKYEIKVNISCEIMQKVSKKDKELSAESLLTYICNLLAYMYFSLNSRNTVWETLMYCLCQYGTRIFQLMWCMS